MNQYQNNFQQQQPQQTYYPNNQFNQNMLPPQYKPLGAWAYFGYSILFTLPIVGFIMLLVFSFSDANINRRNFARSYWCMLAVVAVIAIVVGILSLVLGLGFSGLARNTYY